jgi:4-hydroxybenzoate polyprenyltransferase
MNSTASVPFWDRLLAYGNLVRFSHTLFAMPFALASYAVAAERYGFSWRVLGWVLMAMVGARTAAMTFNRICDRDLDLANPRTRERELPSGKIALAEAWLLLITSSAAFAYAACRLNPLCFALAPVAALVAFGYSFLKRLTWLSHAGLGMALSISPVGAWIAVSGGLAGPPLWLSLAVCTWVAGFDILYAAQDIEFDRRMGLHSLPARFGLGKAFWVSRACHLLTVLAAAVFGLEAGLGWPFWAGWLLNAAVLLYEHSLVGPHDLSRLPKAFFTMNAVFGGVFFVSVVLDIARRLF